jgi:predicted ATP-binding protein involved in virulence
MRHSIHCTVEDKLAAVEEDSLLGFLSLEFLEFCSLICNGIEQCKKPSQSHTIIDTQHSQIIQNGDDLGENLGEQKGNVSFSVHTLNGP